MGSSDLTYQVSPGDILESLVKVGQDYPLHSYLVLYTSTPSVPTGPTPQGEPILTGYTYGLDWVFLGVGLGPCSS